MNCRSGDLAMIVRAGGHGRPVALIKELAGRIVRVTRLVPGNDRVDLAFPCSVDEVWLFEESVWVMFQGSRYECLGIADFCLMPLRNPGEDVADESRASVLRPESVP